MWDRGTDRLKKIVYYQKKKKIPMVESPSVNEVNWKHISNLIMIIDPREAESVRKYSEFFCFS